MDKRIIELIKYIMEFSSVFEEWQAEDYGSAEYKERIIKKEYKKTINRYKTNQIENGIKDLIYLVVDLEHTPYCLNEDLHAKDKCINRSCRDCQNEADEKRTTELYKKYNVTKGA